VSWFGSKKKAGVATQFNEDDPEERKALQNLEIELKARSIRLSDDAIAQAPFDVVHVVQAVFFQHGTSGNSGLVMKCGICGYWVSPQNVVVHLRNMHGMDVNPDACKVAETMHALGANPRDIAAALGARV
jgi:hypothetical protein